MCNYIGVLLLLVIPVVLCTPNFKIDVVYKPNDCERQSRYGDQMFVHFVGRKYGSGEIFDQR